MTLLGAPLHDLGLDDVQRFLDRAEREPLLWEAKGTTRHPDSVRKAVCGFANGRQTAYLILGAEQPQGKGTWELAGMDLDDDPPVWVSSVIQDGLQPVPLVDVRSLPVSGGRHVAVVEVPPIAIPPCISRGTVWERVSGQTIPVVNPLRLSELYARGDSARAGAMSAASGAAEEVVLDAGMPGWDPDHLRFALGVSATGHPADISSRLFSEDYEEKLISIVGERLVALSPGVPFTPEYRIGFSQSNQWLDCDDPHTHATHRWWAVRVIWNGTAVIYFATDSNLVPARDLAREDITNAWTAAWELVEALGGFGPTHMELRIEGAGAMLGPGGHRLPLIKMGRDLLDSPPEEEMFASVERELRRATGEAVYETPAASGDSG